MPSPADTSLSVLPHPSKVARRALILTPGTRRPRTFHFPGIGMRTGETFLRNVRPVRHQAVREPVCHYSTSRGLVWSGAPKWTNPSADHRTTHWLVDGLPRSTFVGHPAHRRSLSNSASFNPGVIHLNGRLLLACRVGYGNQSGIWIGQLDRNWMPIAESFVETVPYHDGESFEDPRFFSHQGQPCLSCAVARGHQTVQCVLEIGVNLRATSYVEFPSPTGARHEKNWIFFENGRGLYCIYHAGRAMHEVYRVVDGRLTPAHAAPHSMTWRWGEIRGGTNVVLADGRYWTLFHSHRRYARTVHYFMGACAFEAEPPFRMTDYTPSPLYYAPQPSQSLLPHDVKHVVFPSGLLKSGNEWTVFAGYNDERVMIGRIQHDNLTRLMVKLPPSGIESGSVGTAPQAIAGRNTSCQSLEIPYGAMCRQTPAEPSRECRGPFA